MFPYQKSLRFINLVSVIAISLAACSAGTENTSTPSDSAPSFPQSTDSAASVTVPGVNDGRNDKK